MGMQQGRTVLPGDHNEPYREKLLQNEVADALPPGDALMERLTESQYIELGLAVFTRDPELDQEDDVPNKAGDAEIEPLNLGFDDCDRPFEWTVRMGKMALKPGSITPEEERHLQECASCARCYQELRESIWHPTALELAAYALVVPAIAPEGAAPIEGIKTHLEIGGCEACLAFVAGCRSDVCVVSDPAAVPAGWKEKTEKAASESLVFLSLAVPSRQGEAQAAHSRLSGRLLVSKEQYLTLAVDAAETSLGKQPQAFLCGSRSGKPWNIPALMSNDGEGIWMANFGLRKEVGDGFVRVLIASVPHNVPRRSLPEQAANANEEADEKAVAVNPEQQAGRLSNDSPVPVNEAGYPQRKPVNENVVS